MSEEITVKRCGAVLAVLAALSSAGDASAHHSAAMFDSTKTVTLTGIIKQFQWTNPHAWLFITVPTPDGKTVEWSIELTSPNLLSRAGWRPGTLKFGDKITVVGAPLRDGGRGAQFKTATFADGRVLNYNGLSAPGAPAPR
jgi:hypothetical protein